MIDITPGWLYDSTVGIEERKETEMATYGERGRAQERQLERTLQRERERQEALSEEERERLQRLLEATRRRLQEAR
jgi:hypothetical protein